MVRYSGRLLANLCYIDAIDLHLGMHHLHYLFSVSMTFPALLLFFKIKFLFLD